MPERRGAAVVAGLAAAVLVTVACGGRGTAARDGTAQMADTLAAIYARASANPMRVAFLNAERADALARTVAGQVGPMALQNRFLLAQERLLAGRTREAIADLERLTEDAALRLDSRAPQNKPFFDLLGIAYLRLGEQQNCVNNPSANVCILPLSGSARHKDEEGARKAIALYERMLRAFPDDRGSQWLLNVAQMAVGGYPYAIPVPWRIPGLAIPRSPSFPLFHNVAGELGLGVLGLSGGLVVEDFNRDGFLDIFTTSWGLTDPPHLFVADGRGGYVDRTAAAGLSRITGGLNAVHADYDNDGFDDILVLRGAWMGDDGAQPNSLLRNKGDGTFEDVTFSAGLASFHPTHSAAWADFNLDGWLDLFVGNESAVATGGTSHRSELYVNNRDGTFTEVSQKFGLNLDAFVKGVTWGDVNNDGLPDLYASVLNGPNRLFVNRGGASPSAWRFEEIPGAAGAALPIMSFPTWFWDYDQDGWEDLLVLSYDNRNSGALHEAVALEYLGLPVVIPRRDGVGTPIESSRLFRNNGNGTFTDATAAAGLAGKALFAMGSNFGDLDNDGWPDFYVGTGNPDLRSIIPNRMFRNVEGRRFAEVTMEGGFAHIQKGHGTAFVDLDRDGDEDIFMEMGGAYAGDRFASILFENPGWPDNRWIVLELEGRTANRSAIGARVTIVVADPAGKTRTLYRTIGTGGSFGDGSLQLHIGVGRAATAVEVRVAWPDLARSTTSYTGLSLGRAYRIVQGAEPTLLARPAVPFRKNVVPTATMPGHTRP